ncbi:MAG: peptide ABC transporter substrate-binding protein [SAR86 cluster bacterium]|jgi:oligopeptide transport system substrate-binding protein|nr:peptide ABC transporter substrate-binding protein [SAR86 cluster bacterium]
MIKKYFYFLLVCFFISCEQSITPVETAIEDKILYLGNGTEPQDLDPHIVTGVPEHNIIIALLEGLMIANPQGGAPLPGVAESWDVSSDGKVYIFKIKDQALWSNGDEVTAADFVFSWKRILTPSLGAQYADMLYILKNAEPFNKGKIKDFSQVGVRAVDAKTLRVELNNPTPYFLNLLTHYSSYPVHRPTIEKFGEIDTRGSEWTREENFIGNGPFILKEWQLNKVLIVKKNTNYWNSNIVDLNEIHFFPIDDVSREDRMYRSGYLHLAYSTPQEKIETYRTKYPDHLRIEPYFGTYYYRVNTLKKPFNDPLVRKALSLAINRDDIVNKVMKGGQSIAFSFTPPDKKGYFPNTQLDFDPQLAKNLLREAGFSKGKFPIVELLYNTSEGHQKVAQAIQQMWKLNLGIDVELVNVDWKVYLSRELSGDFTISRAGWIGDYPDPNSFLDMMVTGRGNNKTGWSNPEYDNLVKLAASAKSTNERFKLFREAESILVNELPVIPIYTYTRVYMLHPDVKGWYPNILDTHPYQFIRLEK